MARSETADNRRPVPQGVGIVHPYPGGSIQLTSAGLSCTLKSKIKSHAVRFACSADQLAALLSVICL